MERTKIKSKIMRTLFPSSLDKEQSVIDKEAEPIIAEMNIYAKIFGIMNTTGSANNNYKVLVELCKSIEKNGSKICDKKSLEQIISKITHANIARNINRLSDSQLSESLDTLIDRFLNINPSVSK